MRLLLAFDTETTGLPLWDQPSSDPGQPHIVQLAASLVDIDTRETVASIDLIVKPDGWVIPQETIDVHGVTNEIANAVGISEFLVINTFVEMWKKAEFRLGHNESFDARMVRIGLKRFEYGDEFADAFKAAPSRCSCVEATPICKVPFAGKKAGFKKPKLGEAYKFFTGQELEGAHRASIDVAACLTVFWGIEDHNAKKA